jgi:4-amino-4-deoxy-L-arabinose transferase-like glycosyltransferase
MHLLDTRRPRWLLLAFCLLVWLPGLFTLPPTDRDESRFAQASKQMLETGDYVRIMNGTEPRNLKPIGIYWLQVPFAAAAHRLHLAVKNPVWPYRLPSLLGAFAAVLATFEIGRSLASRRAALLAAGMLGASVVLVVETHMAKTDAALLGATTVAMAVLARAYMRLPVGRGQAALFWVAMAVGILLKGPITPMVAAFTAVALVVVDRRARWLMALRPVPGAVLMVLLVLPWFIAITFATHGKFFGDAVGGDLGHKLAGGDDAHGAPPGMHLLLLPLLAFPASLPVLLSIPRWWRDRRDPATKFLLAWVLPCWVVFEAVPTKLPHYTLPLYPAIFLLAARVWDGVEAPRGLWGRRIAPGVVMLAAAVLGVAGLVLPVVVHASPFLGLPTLVAAGLVGWLATRPDRPVLALAAMPLFTLSLLGWELPQARPLWVAPQVEQALQSAGLAGRPVAAVGFHEPSLMFLAGTDTVLSGTGQDGAQALASGKAASAVVSDRDEAAFQAEAARLGLPLQAVGKAGGFNYSRGRNVSLTLYKRAATP